MIGYHAYDDAWVPDTLAGKTIEEVGDAHGDPQGDLLGDEPQAAFAAIVATAVSAVRGLVDLDKVVHLSYGDYPAREYLKHITWFRGSRVYDIARFIGAQVRVAVTIGRETHRHGASIADGVARLLDQLPYQAYTVRKRAAIFIAAVVEAAREELR